MRPDGAGGASGASARAGGAPGPSGGPAAGEAPQGGRAGADAVTARTVLVTGSSRGLGRAMALAFGRQGHRVAVHYVKGAEPAEEVAAEIRYAGGEAQTFGADVADAEACQQLVKRVTEAFGSLEILVNNAGIARDTLALRMKAEDWQAVIDTNLSSAFHLSKGALRGMLRGGFGRIVNIASIVGIRGNVGQANYVAAKAGMIGLTKALAREYGARGVTVNAVAPGFIESDMTDALPDEVKQAYLREIPAGRFGRPEDVAAAVLFLAGEDASYINGQTLPVDGGMVMP